MKKNIIFALPVVLLLASCGTCCEKCKVDKTKKKENKKTAQVDTKNINIDKKITD